mgnify:CR=1 FL=1
MDTIDKTTDHMSITKVEGDLIAVCIKELVDKINEIVEWINGQS